MKNGKITEIGQGIQDEDAEIIDATGKYVFPGGIDPHTHLDMPFNNTVTDDDWESGTIAAAFGGTTTILDFCLTTGEARLLDAVDKWHEKAKDKAVIDYGFHLMIADLTEDTLKQLPEALEVAGINSSKSIFGLCKRIPSDRSYIIPSI